MRIWGELIIETISNIIYHDLNIKEYLDSSNSCFLDIETTGLSRKYNMTYLIGVLSPIPDSNSWILKQYFANSMDKEKDLLERFIDDINVYDNIITYNGDSFDLPFINHRLDHYGIKSFVDPSKSFDLYRLIRQNKQYLSLPNLKLKTIEESLGYFREDIYSGFDCIGFYHEYINSKNLELKDNILKHNYDDLVHMLDIIKILDVLDEKKSVTVEFKDFNRSFKIDDIYILGDMINIIGSIDLALEQDISYYSSNYSIATEKLNNFKISMEFKEGYISKEEKCVFIDLLDYPQLNLQDNIDRNLPANIFVLIIEKQYCLQNIKDLLKALLKNVIL